MKITWFGGTTLRIYVGGQIVVVDGNGLPAGVDPGEVLSGADTRVETSDGTLKIVDPAEWRPRPVRRAIDQDDASPLDIFRIGPAALLISTGSEPPLVILGDDSPPAFGRWADGAVIVLLNGSDAMVATATVILDVARPRLVAIAADEQTLDLAIEELSEHLDGAGLVSLEPGLALEV